MEGEGEFWIDVVDKLKRMKGKREDGLGARGGNKKTQKERRIYIKSRQMGGKEEMGEKRETERCRRGHKNYQRKALKEEDKGKEKKLCMNKINTKKGKKEKEKKTKKVE